MSDARPSWDTDDWNPLEAVMRALVAQADGEPFDEEEAQAAAEVLAGAALVRGGLSVDSLERLFMERDHKIRLSYSEAEGLGIEIDWTDGEPGPQPGNDAMHWRPDLSDDNDEASDGAIGPVDMDVSTQAPSTKAETI